MVTFGIPVSIDSVRPSASAERVASLEGSFRDLPRSQTTESRPDGTDLIGVDYPDSATSNFPLRGRMNFRWPLFGDSECLDADASTYFVP